MDKKAFRTEKREYRKQISRQEREEAQEACLHQLLSIPCVCNANFIYCYVSFGTELPTHQMIQTFLGMGKCVAVPKVCGDEMVFYQIHSLEDCEPGLWGILEPKENCTLADGNVGVVLAPGLAFDKKGHRMGYGGGFYDKYLSRHTDLIPIGICYEGQIVEDVPSEEHDICMAYVVSPESILKIGF